MEQGPALLPDDILSAIFVLAQKKTGGERLAFRGHDSQLQTVFRKLTRQYDFPLKNNFVFSNTGPIPYSPAISSSISRLQLSGFVGRENPDYEVLFVRPAAVQYFDSFLRRRLKNTQIAQLQQVANAFLRLVKLA
jgi:hypothetical protein